VWPQQKILRANPVWNDLLPILLLSFAGKLASRTGVKFMDKLIEIRSQEMLCRERAVFDTERKAFWSAKAEEWEQRALDEIAFHFRECNAISAETSAK
jgi:hypothetical protein